MLFRVGNTIINTDEVTAVQYSPGGATSDQRQVSTSLTLHLTSGRSLPFFAQEAELIWKHFLAESDHSSSQSPVSDS
jgi:hypothetical protein